MSGCQTTSDDQRRIADNTVDHARFGLDLLWRECCTFPVFAIGTWINAIAILLGGALGLLIKRDLPNARQQQLRTAVGLGVILSGFQMIWSGLHQVSLGAAFGLIGIALAATTLGQWTGRLIRLQGAMNRAGKFAAETFARAQSKKAKISFNDGFMACSALFCIGPLSLLGPLQEGLNGDFYVLIVKAVMDGLAAFAFSRVFSGSVAMAALPVLALQGTLTLLTAWAAKQAPLEVMLHATNVTGGLLVVCAVLLVFEVRKVKIGDYLPAILFAPLLAWLFF